MPDLNHYLDASLFGLHEAAVGQAEFEALTGKFREPGYEAGWQRVHLTEDRFIFGMTGALPSEVWGA